MQYRKRPTVIEIYTIFFLSYNLAPKFFSSLHTSSPLESQKIHCALQLKHIIKQCNIKITSTSYPVIKIERFEAEFHADGSLRKSQLREGSIHVRSHKSKSSAVRHFRPTRYSDSRNRLAPRVPRKLLRADFYQVRDGQRCPLTHVYSIRAMITSTTPTLKSDRDGTGCWSAGRRWEEHRRSFRVLYSAMLNRRCWIVRVCTCNVISRGVSSTPLLRYRPVSGSFNKIYPLA